MKILFVENRGKTIFWEQVALALQRQGHQIAWIIQNPQYIPRIFASDAMLHVLPFPPVATRQQPKQSEAWVSEHYPILANERGRKHFRAGTAHYAHYTEEINRVLQCEQPDLVIGESTLFHELITIALCRYTGIIYVNPSANRYPNGRFSIFSFETQNPVAGSGEIWPLTKVRALAEKIAMGREIPFYMRMPNRLEKLLRSARTLRTHASVWRGHLNGERYNTPALHQKLVLHYRLKRNLQQWRKLQKFPSQSVPALLYPLQMQPESNIDVWGGRYANQVALLHEMLATAPTNVQIAIKINPKSKYEVSSDLLTLAEYNPRVCLLPQNTTMAQAQACTLGTLTVSGTVGFEAVFGKGRCISLRHPLIEWQFPSLHANSVEEGVNRLLHHPQDGVGNLDFGTSLIQQWVKQSFPGVIGEPLYTPQSIDPQNIQLVAHALHVLASPTLRESA